MERAYHKQMSRQLGREMELLIFGHAGLPMVVFPASGGRFYEFEDHGMVEVLEGKVGAGEVQLFCVDSINDESWCNRKLAPWERVQRQVEYEKHILEEVMPLIRATNDEQWLAALGCSFGGYQAVNIALRNPEVFRKVVSLSGAFDMTGFLNGYYDEDCYFNLPTHYLPNLADAWYLDRLRSSQFILATGWDDPCLGQNQQLDRILSEKGIPHRLDVWNESNSDDWPTWKRMVREYV